METTAEGLHPYPTERVAVCVMRQEWTALTFLHWSLPAHEVRPLVPPALAVDTFDGRAWVSLSPFLMQGLRLAGLPPLPGLERMPETNARTYVRGPDGRPGIFFFSLDIARLSAAVVGRTAYRLPYMWTPATVEVDDRSVRYRGVRRWGGPAAAWDIAIERWEPLGRDALGALDHFLTARWLLYGMYGPVLAATPVEHEPWPLSRGRVTHVHEDLLAAAGLARPLAEPVVHYSPGVYARIGLTRPVGCLPRSHPD